MHQSIELFSSFLKSHNLLEEFHEHSDLPIERAIEYLGLDKILTHTFSWEKHPFGIEFWFDIQEKWINHIN